MGDFERLIALIKIEREERFLEYKTSAPWDSLKEKVTKTAIGMANMRDGGTIIIGVPNKEGRFVPEGMLEEHIATYDADEVQAFINKFADPYVRIEIHPVPWDQKKFLAIVVHEFDEIPVVCKRNSGILRQGAIYTRSYRIPETCEVQTQTEMREIIEMAVEKGIIRFMKMTQRLGIPIEKIAEISDSEAFNKQLEGL